MERKAREKRILERRSLPRLLLRQEVTLQSSALAPGCSISAEMKDLSPVGAQLLLTIEPPDTMSSLRVRVGPWLWVCAEIWHVEPADKGFRTVIIFPNEKFLGGRRRLSCRFYGKLEGTPWFFEAPIKRESFDQDPRLRRLRILVERYYTSPFTLEIAARVVGLEPNYFSSFFKRKIGISFLGWIHAVRLSKAVILLSSSNHSVYEVAELAGFGNLRSFERIFRRQTNLTPSQFKWLQRP